MSIQCHLSHLWVWLFLLILFLSLPLGTNRLWYLTAGLVNSQREAQMHFKSIFNVCLSSWWNQLPMHINSLQHFFPSQNRNSQPVVGCQNFAKTRNLHKGTDFSTWTFQPSPSLFQSCKGLRVESCWAFQRVQKGDKWLSAGTCRGLVLYTHTHLAEQLG